MSKSGLLEEKQADHVYSEKQILFSLKSDYFVTTHAFLQDSRRIYFVQDFIQGGEFNTLLRRYRKFEPDIAAFYLSQLVLSLEHMHSQGICYRDLKPENILIDHTGFLKVIDMGLSK